VRCVAQALEANFAQQTKHLIEQHREEVGQLASQLAADRRAHALELAELKELLAQQAAELTAALNARDTVRPVGWARQSCGTPAADLGTPALA